MSHWGLYIIRVNHFLKSILPTNEDGATVPTALWTLHKSTRVRTGVSPRTFPTSFRGSSAGLSEGSVNLIPFFHIFLFSIPLTRYARYAPGGEIDTLFTRFYWRGWCTGPNETCPPPPPPPGTPHICMYVSDCVCMCVSVCVFVCVQCVCNVCVCVCVNTVCVSLCGVKHVCVCVCVCVCVRVCVCVMCVCVCVCAQ